MTSKALAEVIYPLCIFLESCFELRLQNHVHTAHVHTHQAHTYYVHTQPMLAHIVFPCTIHTHTHPKHTHTVYTAHAYTTRHMYTPDPCTY